MITAFAACLATISEALHSIPVFLFPAILKVILLFIQAELELGLRLSELATQRRPEPRIMP